MPGRAALPPAPGSPSPRNRGEGLPPPGPLSFFHSRGLAAPVRRATRAPSVPPAPLLGDNLSQDSPSREGNRLGMRAPAETRKIQSIFSRSHLRIRDQSGPGSGLSESRPPPQPPRARARGIVGSRTLHQARTAAPAQAGRSSGKADPWATLWIPAGNLELENRRPEERDPTLGPAAPTPCCPQPPATAPGGEEQNAPHRDRGFAPTPLRWIFFFLRCANNSSPDANFPPLPSKLYLSPTSEQSAGVNKKRKIRSQVPSR